MAEYITKKQVIELFRCYAHEYIPIRFEDLEFDIQHMIPEDVAPVRHGRWIMTAYTTISKRNRIISNKRFSCSECAYTNGRNKSNYCPNCGAKMDLEVPENETL